jgi:hypothetical protein
MKSIAIAWMLAVALANPGAAQGPEISTRPAFEGNPGTVQRMGYACGSLHGKGTFTVYLHPEPNKKQLAVVAVIDCGPPPA